MVEGSKSRRERQAQLEFQLRADRGTYLHLPMWLLIAGSIRLDRGAAAVFWINAALMLVTALGRRRFYRGFERLLDRWPRLAATAGRVAIGIPALHWSLLTAASVHDGVLHPLTIPLMFIVVGMATAGTMVLAIDRVVRVYYPLVLMLPFDLALLFRPGGGDVLLPVMSVGVILYVFSATRLVHGSYWGAFAAQSALEERAEDLELLSTTDALTQIPNRLYLERSLAKAWSNAVRTGQPISLLLIDLDHFKAINDTHGHAGGDECLKAAAQALRRGLHRRDDLVTRWGGEEFIVMLPGSDAQAAATIARRLLRAVGNTRAECNGVAVQFTCSIGAATRYPQETDEWAVLINDADRALYLAKDQGRNRVIAVAA